VSVLVKICGLNAPAAVDAAASADFGGFIFFPRSPRHVEPGTAGALAARLPARVKRVAVVVDADDATLDAIVAGLKPDLIQLHGKETPARAREIRARLGCGTIKAMSVSEPADLDAAAVFADAVDFLLFDAKPPKRPDALPGGNAVSFDWTMLAGRRFASRGCSRAASMPATSPRRSLPAARPPSTSPRASRARPVARIPPASLPSSPPRAAEPATRRRGAATACRVGRRGAWPQHRRVQCIRLGADREECQR
jgi:phosphoribosylanthranilate isomerase